MTSPAASVDPLGPTVTSFISFDVEALPGRSASDGVESLVWGRLGGSEYGIRRISKILGMHRLKGNFLIDFAMCLLYGDREVKRMVQFLLEEGHEVHAHLHSEWVVRKWEVLGKWKGPLGLDRTDPQLSDALLQFTAWKYESLTGLAPEVFRSGAYLFSNHTIEAAKRAGFRLISNYNATRHASFNLPLATAHNEPFLWDNRLLELPVDFSPEPLSFDWVKYEGWYHRARTRKKERTFNLVLHSWSLLAREGAQLQKYEPIHEERLNQMCEHLATHTRPSGYSEYLRRRESEPERAAIIASDTCVVEVGERSSSVTCCSICGFAFVKRPTEDTCPGCGSRARHRQLKDVFARLGNPFDGKVVLANYANLVEQRAFLRGARSVLNFDVRPVSEVELQMDVQDLVSVRAGSIDAFLGIHVLNHVRDDERALREISRVLKPGGLACLTLPYRDNFSTTALPDPTEHYGADALEKYGVGTFRRYGLNDALTQLRAHFEVDAQGGTDPVTGDTMLVFLLRRPASSKPHPEA